MTSLDLNYLCKDSVQIQSHSEVLRVRVSTNEFAGGGVRRHSLAHNTQKHRSHSMIGLKSLDN